jgi:hypothetical protein
MVFGRTRALIARARNEPSPPRSGAGRVDDDWLRSVSTSEVREGGESLWEAWQDESRRMDLGFAQTQPSDLAPLTSESFSATPQPQSPGGPWTVDDVLALAGRNNRVCPRPALWFALYLLLEGARYTDLRRPPMHSSMLSSMNRRLQFREHIKWADRHGKLEELAEYIASLAEPDWIHLGDD